MLIGSASAVLQGVFQPRAANFNIFELNKSCYFCLVLQKTSEYSNLHVLVLNAVVAPQNQSNNTLQV